MVRLFRRFGMDITEHPILVYPTLHYQNGGVAARPDGSTGIPNLYVAGEVLGGVHGRNRLMGNSLLDVTVFGRRAGQAASRRARDVILGKLTLAHIEGWECNLARAGVETDLISPLVLPDYTGPQGGHG
jgi:succinate dehydrogenase / fumarate reductase flavoprotein subunit